ncbi:hypothetical protein Trichorick_00039 [Candidatus Trichorickettsia mobilis]|uniref:Archease domain-containing protein n=1 Tax=Candidatus Trichorickettsia mobilis TaxID=1346319 RepID=A0ABZ0UQ45_9RICK|nr:hypothetical protein [Candidatus Trichorickettsia mobilis]WPY00169.1 hypothetical protein Trichorick_00039 [Candidatus Trichorickettsia mobilis]
MKIFSPERIFYNYSENDINLEAVKNLSYIIAEEDEDLKLLTFQKFKNLFYKIVDKKASIIFKDFQNKSMFFYSWFDTSKISFSLVSSVYKRLPFETEIILQSNLRCIFDDFINFQVISFNDMQEITYEESLHEEESHQVQVFAIELPAKKVLFRFDY